MQEPQGIQDQSLGQEGPLEEEMATHSSRKLIYITDEGLSQGPAGRQKSHQ